VKDGDPCTHEWKTPEGRDRRKCPAHNFWMKKGECELCRLERERRLQEYEKEGGSNKPPVKIGKI
jgi:ribosomal protein L37E